MPGAYAEWIGREERLADVADAGAYGRLAQTLDLAPRAPPATAPRLGHWLHFAPSCLTGALGPDGHPPRGDFLPPVDLPRRMWAGGRLTFLADIPVGASLERWSRIGEVTQKSGRSGAMVFVLVHHEIFADGILAVREEQDIVYRAPDGGAGRTGSDGAVPSPEPAPADFERTITAEPPLLFRYSALTWNAHRIHYDAPYARDVEGYSGLVVHGPLTATLLLDLVERSVPGARITGYRFRAETPLFAGRPMRLCARAATGGFSLVAEDDRGQRAMTAEAQVS